MAYRVLQLRDEASRLQLLDKDWRSLPGDIFGLDGLNVEIIRSWRRVRDTVAGDPQPRRCTELLPPGDLGHRRQHDEVYALAAPVIEEFAARLMASGHVLTFFDVAGWRISGGGRSRTAEGLAEIDCCLSLGASQREESAGTDEAGAVEVLAKERFIEAWQSGNCCAAPVFGPGTGEPVGIIDISGPWTTHDVRGLVMTRAVARAIEERLRSAWTVRDQVIECAFRTAASGSDGLFAVNTQGRVVSANEAARERLPLCGVEVPPPLRQILDVGLRGDEAADGGEWVVEWPGVLGEVRLVATPIRYERHTVGALVRVPSSSRSRRARAAAHPVPRAAAAVTRYDFGRILGESRAIAEAVALAHAAARNELPVVISGESGTGKELFAQAIHSASTRARGPFIALSCGCIAAALLEAELFGYEPGTFTGGRKEGNSGKFEDACGGTLFLDEVSELSLHAQTALLRVLQEREVVRLGGSARRRVDTRIIAATNKPLPEEIRAGRFRADLFFRLNVLAIDVPSLRERRSDVALLAGVFLRSAGGELGREGLLLSGCALRALEAYSWPGNVRELQNVILRAAATASREVIEAKDLPAEVRGAESGAPAPRREEPSPADVRGGAEPDRETLLRALESASGNVKRTAQALRVSRMTLYRWLHKHRIER